MSEFQPLIDQLYRERIARARKQDPAMRISEAFELTDFAIGVMFAGVRAQHPEAEDAEILRLARERIALGKRAEERVLYRRVEREP